MEQEKRITDYIEHHRVLRERWLKYLTGPKVPDSIPALSVIEPWGTLIIRFDKNVENRTWRTHVRGPVVICASQQPERWNQFDVNGMIEEYREDNGYAPPEGMQNLLRVQNPGHALGIVNLTDCRYEMDGFWSMPEQYQFVMAARCPFTKPFPIKGQRGFWSIPKSQVLAAV